MMLLIGRASGSIVGCRFHLFGGIVELRCDNCTNLCANYLIMAIILEDKKRRYVEKS